MYASAASCGALKKSSNVYVPDQKPDINYEASGGFRTCAESAELYRCSATEGFVFAVEGAAASAA